jgi:hypothetical protein
LTQSPQLTEPTRVPGAEAPSASRQKPLRSPLLRDRFAFASTPPPRRAICHPHTTFQPSHHFRLSRQKRSKPLRSPFEAPSKPLPELSRQHHHTTTYPTRYHKLPDTSRLSPFASTAKVTPEKSPHREKNRRTTGPHTTDRDSPHTSANEGRPPPTPRRLGTVPRGPPWARLRASSGPVGSASCQLARVRSLLWRRQKTGNGMTRVKRAGGGRARGEGGRELAGGR